MAHGGWVEKAELHGGGNAELRQAESSSVLMLDVKLTRPPRGFRSRGNASARSCGASPEGLARRSTPVVRAQQRHTARKRGRMCEPPPFPPRRSISARLP